MEQSSRPPHATARWQFSLRDLLAFCVGVSLIVMVCGGIGENALYVRLWFAVPTMVCVATVMLTRYRMFLPAVVGFLLAMPVVALLVLSSRTVSARDLLVTIVFVGTLGGGVLGAIGALRHGYTKTGAAALLTLALWAVPLLMPSVY